MDPYLADAFSKPPLIVYKKEAIIREQIMRAKLNSPQIVQKDSSQVLKSAWNFFVAHSQTWNKRKKLNTRMGYRKYWKK